jgi:hypothetical protein
VVVVVVVVSSGRGEVADSGVVVSSGRGEVVDSQSVRWLIAVLSKQEHVQ